MTAPAAPRTPAVGNGTSSGPAVDLVRRLAENVKRVFVGREKTVEHVLTSLLAEGHLLIEDAPGVGKTTLAKALARSIDASFKRIQFTPDLLPSDIVGVSVFDQATTTFAFKPGPIFANVVLADEINRTNPRTQSSLLEAMSEPTVSVDGEPHALPRPFLVLATQNPHEFEGTYPLPESQLDRFLLRIRIGYPSAEQEREVLRAQEVRHPLDGLQPVVSAADVLRMQEATRHVRVEDPVLDYIVAIAQRSRELPELVVGVSPRGSLALRRAAQALALVRGRDHVVPDDVKELVGPVLGHRVVTAREVDGDDALAALVDSLPAPV